jgi:hypothetical protein
LDGPRTGILKDGDVLVLTLTRFENGKPDRAVIALTLDGDTEMSAYTGQVVVGRDLDVY